jgi:hypothetical protein
MLPSFQLKAPPGVGDGEVPMPAIPTGGLLVAAWHVLITHTSTTISVATPSSPAITPSTVAAAHCSSSNASATASPSNRWSLDRVTTSHFRVNSGQPPASAFGGSLSRQSDIDPIPKVIHRKRYLRCADIDRKFALALLRHGRCKRV